MLEADLNLERNMTIFQDIEKMNSKLYDEKKASTVATTLDEILKKSQTL